MGKDLDRTAENGNMVQKAAEQAVELDEDMLGGVSGGANTGRTASERKYHECGSILTFMQNEGTYYCLTCKRIVAPGEILSRPGVRIGENTGDHIIKA